MSDDESSDRESETTQSESDSGVPAERLMRDRNPKRNRSPSVDRGTNKTRCHSPFYRAKQDSPASPDAERNNFEYISSNTIDCIKSNLQHATVPGKSSTIEKTVKFDRRLSLPSITRDYWCNIKNFHLQCLMVLMIFLP